MNKKITFPELIESVATTTEASKRTSEMFLKELFAVIADSLVKGENVKIKNFGQFKLTEVGERKSVNVNTGEEMKIPSHTKVSFIPDKVLADAINMPFANFEAIELSDNISESELKIMASTEDGQVAKADAEGRKKQFDGETVDSGNGMKENETTEDLHENHEQDNAVATEPEIEGADIDDSKEEGSISPDAEEEDGVCEVILLKEGGAEGGFDIEFAFRACLRNFDRSEFALPSVVIGIEFGDVSFFARGAVFVDGDEGAVRRLLRAVISAPFFGERGEEIDDFVLARLVRAFGLLFGDEGIFFSVKRAVLAERCSFAEREGVCRLQYDVRLA